MNTNNVYYYTLMNDIDGVDFTLGENQNKGFIGYFDGQGHTITLNINTTDNYVGFFGTVGTQSSSGYVSNLVVAGTVTSTGYCVGGIAGYVQNYSKLTNCVNKARVEGNNRVGGIAGSVYSGVKIIDCVDLGNVYSTNSDNFAYTGGLVGMMDASSCWVLNSCVGLDVTISNTSSNFKYLGGLVGYVQNPDSYYKSKICNCVNYSPIRLSAAEVQTYKDNCSHLIGGISNDSPYVTVENCFWFIYDLGKTNWTDHGVGYGSTSEKTVKNNLEPFVYDGWLINRIGYDTVEGALKAYASSNDYTTWDRYIFVGHNLDGMLYVPAYYRVNIPQFEGATISCNTLTAKAGTSIRATCTLNGSEYSFIRWQGEKYDGFDTSSLVITDGQFTMPDDNVNVIAHICRYYAEVPSTCSSAGTRAYYYCSACDKKYADNQEQTAYADDADLVIAKLSHDFPDDSNGFCSVCSAYQPIEPEKDGSYIIMNAGQLYWFAEQVNINSSFTSQASLDADIDAHVVSEGEPTRRAWTTINKYDGNFDGNNHTIRGLSGSEENSPCAIFNQMEGNISNLTVDESSFSSPNYGAAGIVFSCKGVISNCHNYAMVSASNSTAGGVAGSCYNRVVGCTNHGTIEGNSAGGVVYNISHDNVIERCANFGNVNAGVKGGGIACSVAYNVDMNNCYNTGDITANNAGTGVGGLCGNVSSLVDFNNCYSTGTITGDNKGLLARLDATSGAGATFTNCYALNKQDADLVSYTTSDLKPTLVNSGIKSAEEFADGTVCYLLNGSTSDGELTWKQDVIDEAAPSFAGPTVAYNAETKRYYNPGAVAGISKLTQKIEVLMHGEGNISVIERILDIILGR